MKIFISQPMRDKTDEQVKSERAKAVEKVKELYPNDNVEILDTFFESAPHDAKPLWFLGKSIQYLGNADIAYFVGDWKKYRGCCAENYVAKSYGIKVIEE